jgi:hypothetical protein
MMRKSKARLATDDPFSFDKLKLVDKPDSPKNAKELPLTLEGCEGCLSGLPLRAPNVDQKNPKTVQDMVNILTDPEAGAAFIEAGEQLIDLEAEAVRSEGLPSVVYDYQHSGVMKKELNGARKRTSHQKAPGVLGHIVNPGCISFYKRDGKTFAVTEGRWMLTSIKASWIAKNVPLDQDKISLSLSQVFILRVPPGCVGRIRDQGVEILLDVGTHVFNSGTVTDNGTDTYAGDFYINHGETSVMYASELSVIGRFLTAYLLLQVAIITSVFRAESLPEYGLK